MSSSDSEQRHNTELDAMLAEYSTLREESLAAISHRMTATNFSFAALSLLVAGLISGKAPRLVAAPILVFVVPQLAKAALLIWLGEYHRSQRAGRHIARLEDRINRLLGANAMTWETGLSSSSTHMGYPYVAVVVLLLGSGYVAELLGLGIAAQGVASNWSTTAIIALCVGATCVIAGIELRFHGFFMSRWRDAKTGALREAGDEA